MAVIKKVWDTGLVRDVEIVSTSNKKIDRKEKAKITSSAQKLINQQAAQKKLTRLVNKNFKFGDAHVILRYHPDNIPNARQAKKDLEKFHRTMRRAYKKLKLEYKYIATSEHGQRSIHHHLIINQADIGILTSSWLLGSVKIFPLYRDGQYKKLAEYIIKQTSDTFNDPQRRIHAKRWCQSSNLKIPKPKVKKVKADAWMRDPIIPKGWLLEAASHERGVNQLGYPYQFYTLRKLIFSE